MVTITIAITVCVSIFLLLPVELAVEVETLADEAQEIPVLAQPHALPQHAGLAVVVVAVLAVLAVPALGGGGGEVVEHQPGHRPRPHYQGRVGQQRRVHRQQTCTRE